MCVQVDYSNRDASGRVISIGGRGGGGLIGQPWRISVARAAELMDEHVQYKGWVFFTVDDATGRRALVTPTIKQGRTLLTTTPDGTKQNNLDYLPGGNLDVPESDPAFPERPYLKTPALVDVLRGSDVLVPLRGGAFPTQPVASVGVRFQAPWPALLEVTVNRTEVPDVGFSSGGHQPQLDAADLGWYFIESIVGMEPGTALQTWTIRVVPPVGLRHSPVRIAIRQRNLAPRCLPQPNDGKLLADKLKGASLRLS